MKKLSLDQLEVIQGGGAKEVVDIFCGGANAAGVVLYFAKVAMGPVGIGINVACGVYGAGRVLDWW